MGRFIIKRRAGQKFLINADISITVLKSTNGSTSLMIEMPDNKLITLVRDEQVTEALNNANVNSANSSLEDSDARAEFKPQEQNSESQQETVSVETVTETTSTECETSETVH